MIHIAGIETVLDEMPARSFSIRNMAGFPYHITLSCAWKSNHIADTKEAIAEIIDHRLNRVCVGVKTGQFHELFEGLKNLIESSFFSTKK